MNAQTGEALNFDGIDDAVTATTLSNIPIGNSNYTIEAWINPETMGDRGIIGWGNYGTTNQVNAFRLTNDGLINYWWGNDLTVVTGDISGSWHHVAVTYDGNQRVIYLDGNVIGTDNPMINSHNVPNINDFAIGLTAPFLNEYFEGFMDEVRIWNVARTSCEIYTYKDCEIPTTSAGLVANYHFNQGVAAANNASENTLIDDAGNNNNGNLTNFSLAGSASNWVALGGVVSGNITPANPISISSGPSSYTICESQPVTFSAIVQGNALGYQWRKNAVNISGANYSSYTIPSVVSADAANYDLVVTGICGDPSVIGTPIFSPSNPITSFGGSSPVNEGVANAIDGDPNTKYLNFGEINTGFDLDAGSSSIANMIMLTTSNDGPERDPFNYEVYGSTDNITFNLITSGILPCSSNRRFSRYFAINNSTAYRYYRFKVPTVCDANSANSMSIGEVQLYSDVIASTLTTSVGTLAVNPSSYGDTTATACFSFNWNGTDYYSSGNFVQAYTNSIGCDSLVTLHLTLLNNFTYNPQTVCYGETYTFNGHTYSGTGYFEDTLQNQFGCDSIIGTDLTELSKIASYNWQEIAAGTSYTFNGNTYVVAGDYSDTLTSSIGCDSIVYTHLVIVDLPNVSDVTICSNSTATLLGNSADINFWYSDMALTNLLSTSIDYTAPTLINSTTYYVAGAVSLDYFKIDTILGSNYHVNDHDDITGDDRGGIAITPNYVYITGDYNTARFTVDLTDSIQLPLRDGLFSDLKTGKIYSISNGTYLPEYYDLEDASDMYNFTEIVELNDTLEPTSNIITLSQPIITGNYNTQAGIFAGKGFLVVYSGYDYKWYAVRLTDGKVTDLGYLADAEFYGGENWADWGVAEFDGTHYSVIFRDYNDDNIHRRVLPDSASTVIGSFSYLTDMANLTYSPWNQRWYFHHENDSEFGGDSETIGYADASDSSSVIKVPSSFAKAVTVTVENLPVVNLGADVVQCAGSVNLDAGNAGASYLWSDNSTTQTITVSVSDTFVVSVTNTCGTVVDSIAVDVDNCVGINEIQDDLNLKVYPNPSTGIVNISYEMAEVFTVQIIDALGKVIFLQANNSRNAYVDLSNYGTGIYSIRVSSNSGSFNRNVIITK